MPLLLVLVLLVLVAMPLLLVVVVVPWCRRRTTPSRWPGEGPSGA